MQYSEVLFIIRKLYRIRCMNVIGRINLKRENNRKTRIRALQIRGVADLFGIMTNGERNDRSS